MKAAAIDIGTVTTRLLIADVCDGAVQELVRRVNITHLGAGLGMTGCLSADGIDRVATVCAGYKELMDAQDVKRSRCVATSAARDARNTDQLRAALERCGLLLEVISGDEEAALSFAGATYGRSGEGLLVVDPGGGSTEFVLGDILPAGSASGNGRGARFLSAPPAGETPAPILRFARSLQMGSQRMTDSFLPSDPPTAAELSCCRQALQSLLDAPVGELRGNVREMTAVAGTATSMVTVRDSIDPYDAARVQDARVTRAQLRELEEQFCAVPTAQRARICGLEPQRASVIIAGTLILQEILDFLALESFRISDTDLLYGILLKLSV